LLVFGGEGEGGECLDDLWVLKLSTCCWRRVIYVCMCLYSVVVSICIRYCCWRQVMRVCVCLYCVVVCICVRYFCSRRMIYVSILCSVLYVFIF